MPWIDEEMCVACGICVDECPVEAIAIPDNAAIIDDDKCIHCGHCHGACPQEAVRHDSERIPEEVEKNITWTKELLNHEYYTTPESKEGLLKRMKNHFIKNKKIAEQTLEQLEELP